MKTNKNAVLLLPVLLLAIGILCSFKVFKWEERIKGNGMIKEEARPVTGAFKNIATSGVFKVIIEQGSAHSIRIEAEENLLPYLLADISGDELELHTKKGYQVQNTKPITVYVTMKEVDLLSASGAGGFTSKGKLTSNRIQLRFSGAADANLDIQAQQLKVAVSGASNIKLKGSAIAADYGISGAADIAALDLSTDEVKIGISGTGTVDVYAQKKLNVSISGMGQVKYKGEPAITKAVAGMGKLMKI
ncbi:head GIN domain-containing protein [Chitinophaga sp. 30R24]|uniref:head GIN domain-containing protein n=1 Tax=Chitinophaga sp. 30R24 TaxID=3248838 RepID=UPI003B904FA3